MQREREGSFNLGFILKMVVVARAGPDKNQELENPSKSPTWVSGTQALASSTAFPDTLAGS